MKPFSKIPVVKFLIEDQNADVNARRNNDSTSLYLAAMRGHDEIVRFLIGKGAIVDAQNDKGKHPLWIASFYGRLTTVKILAKEYRARNISIDKPNKNDSSSLIVAAQEGKLHVVKYLVNEQNAVVNRKNNFGQTPLYWADKKGHDEVVQFLKSHGGTK